MMCAAERVFAFQREMPAAFCGADASAPQWVLDDGWNRRQVRGAGISPSSPSVNQGQAMTVMQAPVALL
jgi:hypothetical protein